MPKTRIFTVDAVPPDEQVVVQTNCSVVRIRENGSPTSDYMVRSPGASDDQLTVPAGREYIFQSIPGSFFVPNQVIGFVSVASSSITMAQTES